MLNSLLRSSQRRLLAHRYIPRRLPSYLSSSSRAFSGPPSFIEHDLPRTFDTVLIANRGEIACRVIKTCRALGIKTVAVYSDVDAGGRHVAMADEAYRIGTREASDSYLRSDRIMEVAKRSGAQAIHPGYGFLSENAEFAKLCEQNGIEFIGPPTNAIVSMGSKSASKRIMEDAKVPVVPGYHGDEQAPEFLAKEADRIGYPIMIKAVAGGGGKGMRVCMEKGDFQAQLSSAQGEAMSSFGNSDVILERYIATSRHIEFQVFADKHGGAVHLMERDCSVQRRAQKVLEEAPAPGMTPELRAEMGKSAVDAALAVGYVGAGTVEFIVDHNTDEYFFMEMNTRLQVEHPVTEMVTRKDLVQLQLHVAAGHPLPCDQDSIPLLGHSIEARVYAEKPETNFLPSSGTLKYLAPPTETDDVRVETGVRQGDEVSVFYDPMIAKLVCWAPDRESSLAKLYRSLCNYQIVGLSTNVEFLKRAVAHKQFRAGRVTTSFIPENKDELLSSNVEPAIVSEATIAAVASLLLSEQSLVEARAGASADSTSPWGFSTRRRFNAPSLRTLKLLRPEADSKQEIDVGVEYAAAGGASYKVTLDGASSVTIKDAKLDGQEIELLVDDKVVRATVVKIGPKMTVFIGESCVELETPSISFDKEEQAGAGAVSPMHGRVITVCVKPGQEIKKGEVLVIVEAMKMRLEIKAANDGVVEKLLCSEGENVESDQLLVQVNEGEEDGK